MLDKRAQAFLAATALVMASLSAIPAPLIKQAEANHGTQSDGTPISGGKWWSTNSAHGHLNELNCSGSDCKIPMFLHSSLGNVKGSLTFSQVATQAINAMDYLGTASSKIGLLSQPLTQDWDNKVSGKVLPVGELGRYENVLVHWWFGYDNHLLRVEVAINTNQHADHPTYALSESCDQFGNPTQVNIQKVFRHEFYHVMGFTHSGETNSILYIQYTCGTGFNFTAHDSQAIRDKYGN